MEFCSVLEVAEEKQTRADTVMEKSEANGQNETCKEINGTVTTAQINDQEMLTEEQEMTSQIEEGMGASHTQMIH